jgi:hypothetical protein
MRLNVCSTLLNQSPTRSLWKVKICTTPKFLTLYSFPCYTFLWPEDGQQWPKNFVNITNRLHISCVLTYLPLLTKRSISTFCMLHTYRYWQQLLPPGHECATWYLNTDNDTILFQDFSINLRLVICVVSDHTNTVSCNSCKETSFFSAVRFSSFFGFQHSNAYRSVGIFPLNYKQQSCHLYQFKDPFKDTAIHKVILNIAK